jgi:hypothetical protein
MAAGEYMRLPPNFFFTFVHGPTIPVQQDDRNWFLMSSYKLSSKLTGGVYYSSTFDHKAPLGPARYQKDWTVSARYDVSSYVYLKAEQHFMDGTGGTAGSFNPTDNTNVQPETKMTLLKIGVSF